MEIRDRYLGGGNNWTFPVIGRMEELDIFSYLGRYNTFYIPCYLRGWNNWTFPVIGRIDQLDFSPYLGR